ncbi:uncharacterized protein A4U43_C01F21070 [Asparagus officinalis]|uniref:DNA-directed RNA polymerase subunit n=1 Tax=Asparagus officinalis TaxID=4686 RepID=A0A5P1FR81_ASPOF|nr:uncharacterized protein LOC109843006 isoform X2 [Asparagus officinalis]ONK80728.1 uncharacterized protein A4U43_C01F21070 [Asparagus officinalis]
MEGLRVVDANLTVYIHPSKARNSRHAILRQLSSLLFTYSEVFDGVILAFEVDIKSTCCKILPRLIPNFGAELKANLLLFSPMLNMLVEGKVVKLGKESIHAIVLGFSSASIMSEDIRKELKFNIKHGEEVFSSTSHKRHVIKVGSIVRFSVKRHQKRHREGNSEKDLLQDSDLKGNHYFERLNHPQKSRKRTE